jgi:hypothetical protein
VDTIELPIIHVASVCYNFTCVLDSAPEKGTF